MKKIVVAILAGALFTIPQSMQAQQRGRGPGAFLQQQNQIAAFLEKADSLQLNLSIEQTQQLETLRNQVDEQTEADRSAMADLMQQMAGGPDQSIFQQMQPHMQAIQQANQTALDAAHSDVLNDMQWTAVDAYLQSIRPQGRGRRGGGGGPPGG